MDLLGAGDLAEQAAKEAEKKAKKVPEKILSPLASHIHETFQRNKRAKTYSNVEEEILLGQRMAAKEYSPHDKKIIAAEGGTDIYMPVGAQKIKTLVAWIKDILQNPKQTPFSIEPTEIPELPKEVTQKIAESIELEFTNYLQDPKTNEDLMDDFQKQQELRYDLKEIIYQAIRSESLDAFKFRERQIIDQFQEGNWDEALAEFIEDFAIYPTAIMKGPILTRAPLPKYKNGKMVIEPSYKFLNMRVDPMDFFPDPNSSTVQEGDLIEIIRTPPSELSNMKGLPGWKDEVIDKILTAREGFGNLWTTDYEQERAELEHKGSASDASYNIHFGMHYFGLIPKTLLESWDKSFSKYEDDYIEVEAIMYGSEVAKVIINEHPEKRRPYYTASFSRRAGSIWGISLPYFLDGVQRVCNSSIRALVNNMALSARPLTVMNIERLAQDGPIDELTGGDIIQVTDDPHGSNSKPIEFTFVPSNAQQLLSVYDSFMQKADEISMIPRYAHGSTDAKGAAATAQGLSMLMESASKGIKEAIKHIDDGLIKPRVELQFYWNMKLNPDDKFNGDINVIALGSETLAIKGAREVRRNEFLMATSNEIDQQIMGRVARADILREMSSDLGFITNVVPNRFKLRRQEALEEQKRAEAMQMQAQQQQVGLQATKLQIDGQKEMHQGTQAVKVKELEAKVALQAEELQLAKEKLALEGQKFQASIQADMAKTQAKIENEDRQTNKKLAADLSKASGTSAL